MKQSLAQQLLAQGIAASKTGRRQDARRLLLQAVDLAPDNEIAWLWLSGAVDSLEERQHCLEQVLRLNPDSSPAKSGLAWIAQQQSEPESATTAPTALTDTTFSAERELHTAEVCPFCSRSVSRRSTVCPACGRDLEVVCPACGRRADLTEQTCQVCGYALGDYRRGTAYFAALGKAYLRHRKPDLARTAWQSVLALDPNYPNAHLFLGQAQRRVGDWSGAQASFEQATRSATNRSAAYLGLGQVHERRHQWDDAQAAYEQAIAADPESAAANFALGLLLAEGKALQAAFPYIRRATELDPELARAWFLLGRLYELAEEPRKAIRAFERASDIKGHVAPQNHEWSKRASERLEKLRPSLPPSIAMNWPETVRQTAAMALVPALAALVNGGLRPWQIAPLDILGILVATLGAYFVVSSLMLPSNPGMRAMLGEDGLSQPVLRGAVGLFGGLFWSVALLYILLAPLL